jgi:hypothetical protein
MTELSRLINGLAAGASRARIPTRIDSVQRTMSSHSAKDDPQPPEDANVVVTGFSVSALPKFLKSSIILYNADCLGITMGTRHAMASASNQYFLAQRERHAPRHFPQRKAKYPHHQLSRPHENSLGASPEARSQVVGWRQGGIPFVQYIDPEKPNSEFFKVDAVLHIDMLGKPEEAYRLERNAFKHEYSLPDVDRRPPDEDDETGGGTWKHVPKKCPRTSILTGYFNGLAQS